MTAELTVPRLRAVPAVADDTSLRRGLDVVVAVVGLICAAPLLLGLGVAVRLTSRGPAFFRQVRIGRGEQPFRIWKLRTMTVTTEPGAALVSGTADPRITRIGTWLRQTRLDELPQLVNLLRGELTLVGPRPEVARFIQYYTPAEQQILRVRPGIIGPGALLFATEQSHQLDTAADPEAHYIEHHLHARLSLDMEYLANRTLRRDLALIARAVGVTTGLG